MKFKGTLIAVSDMGKSRRFYNDVLGLKTEADFGANIMLEGGVFLQTLETWKGFIRDRQVDFAGNDCELYFEEADMEDFLNRLRQHEIAYVHEPIEHSWGQTAVRFYDPDGHIIEVAEEIDRVAQRFVDSGMKEEETAARMGVPVDFVRGCLSRRKLPIERIEELTTLMAGDGRLK